MNEQEVEKVLRETFEPTKATIRIEEMPGGNLRRSGMVIVGARASVQELDRACGLFFELWDRFDEFAKRSKEERSQIEWTDQLVERLPLNALALAMSDEEAESVPFPFRQMRGEDMRGKTLGDVLAEEEGWSKIEWLAQLDPKTTALKRAVAAAMHLTHILRPEEEEIEF